MLRLLLPLLLVLPIGAPTRGWSADGHRIVCRIAWLELDREARGRVERLLEGEPKRYRSFAEACVWADREGRRGRYRDLGHLHYVNIARGADGYDAARDCADGCVVSAIDDHSRRLGDESLSRRERAVSLKFLAHFVADLHQPLHVGYRDDRGGNLVAVRWLGRTHDDGDPPRRLNLHTVWDRELLVAMGGSGKRWRRFAAELRGEIRPSERVPVDAAGWADESWEILRRDVHRGTDLDEAYLASCAPTVRLQLRRAGARLAARLARILAD